MVKKRVSISLDPKSIESARAAKINISEISQDALDRALEIRIQYLKENAKSIEEMMKNDLDRKRTIDREHSKLLGEQKRIAQEMREHVKAAKNAGIERGQAETDYGRVFPDAIWDGGMT